jgi:outer membrane protein assembly factor BamD
MKNYKCLILAVLLASLVGCKTTPTGSEAFKGKSPEEIYSKGEKALSKKHFKESVSEFEAFDALYPFDSRSEQAQVDLIYAYYRSNDFDSAVAAADRYLRLYPMSPKAPYVCYLRGVVNMERNLSWIYNAFPCDPAKRDLANMQQAFSDFQRVLTLYPNCVYAADAQRRMFHIKGTLARHEYQIAEFYFMRHAYVAAANRASYIVQHLPGTQEVPAALIIMVKSYRALGHEELANDALEVLRLNYPERAKGL